MSRLGQKDVGHEDVITGCDAFSLRSSIADPQGVDQSPLQSTYFHGIAFNKSHLKLVVKSKKLKVQKIVNTLVKKTIEKYVRLK